MIVKDSYSASSSGIFKLRKLIYTLPSFVLILVFIYLSSKTGKVYAHKRLLSVQSYSKWFYTFLIAFKTLKYFKT